MIPQSHWKRITVEETVQIPNADGDGIAETLRVEVEAWQDPEDGEIYLDATALKKLDDVRARHMGLMLPEGIAELRRYLGLSQREISRLLRIGEKTWTRWETGRSRPTHSYNLILNALADGRIDLNYLALLAGAQLHTQAATARPLRNEPIGYNVQETTKEIVPEEAS